MIVKGYIGYGTCEKEIFSRVMDFIPRENERFFLPRHGEFYIEFVRWNPEPEEGRPWVRLQLRPV